MYDTLRTLDDPDDLHRYLALKAERKRIDAAIKALEPTIYSALLDEDGATFDTAGPDGAPLTLAVGPGGPTSTARPSTRSRPNSRRSRRTRSGLGSPPALGPRATSTSRRATRTRRPFNGLRSPPGAPPACRGEERPGTAPQAPC